MFYRKYAILHRKAAKNNRKVALDGIDKIPGKDLDEYSPAMLRESGKGSSVLDEWNGGWYKDGTRFVDRGVRDVEYLE